MLRTFVVNVTQFVRVVLLCFRTENCQRKYNISTKYLVKRKRIVNVNLRAGFSTVNTEKHGKNMKTSKN